MSNTDELISLKLISLNIEGDNHYKTVIPFLQHEQADVICLQEVLEIDVEYIKQSVSMKGLFTPTMYLASENKVRLTPGTSWGELFLTKLPETEIHTEYYVGQKDVLPNYDPENANAWNKVILIGEVEKGNVPFTIITTHFTWSANGEATDLQRENLKAMLALLDKEKEFVLCGDFNAPRGREIWNMIAMKYKDNIPLDVSTTIDPELHRDKEKKLQLVVDGLFSTNDYIASDVRVVTGVSDHTAIVATISRASRQTFLSPA